MFLIFTVPVIALPCPETGSVNLLFLSKSYQYYNYVPTTEGDAGHIAFGADGVGIRVASCLHSIS